MECDQLPQYWRICFDIFLSEVVSWTGIEALDSTANYWQAALALGKRDELIRLIFLMFDCLALGYNYSATSELRDVKCFSRTSYEEQERDEAIEADDQF